MHLHFKAGFCQVTFVVCSTLGAIMGSSNWEELSSFLLEVLRGDIAGACVSLLCAMDLYQEQTPRLKRFRKAEHFGGNQRP